MAGTLMGNELVREALDGAGTCQLMPSDGAASTLNFCSLRAGITQSTGLNVQAPEPEGTHGVFNSKTANVATRPVAPEQPQPGLTPDMVLAQQQLSNTGYKPT